MPHLGSSGGRGKGGGGEREKGGRWEEGGYIPCAHATPLYRFFFVCPLLSLASFSEYLCRRFALHKSKQTNQQNKQTKSMQHTSRQAHTQLCRVDTIRVKVTHIRCGGSLRERFLAWRRRRGRKCRGYGGRRGEKGMRKRLEIGSKTAEERQDNGGRTARKRLDID